MQCPKVCYFDSISIIYVTEAMDLSAHELEKNVTILFTIYKHVRNFLSVKTRSCLKYLKCLYMLNKTVTFFNSCADNSVPINPLLQSAVFSYMSSCHNKNCMTEFGKWYNSKRTGVSKS